MSTEPKIDTNLVAACASILTGQCHSLAFQAGWWHRLDTNTENADTTFNYKVDCLGGGMKPGRNIGELLCLIHSEISEAMEGARKGLMDDKLPHRPMLEVELADAVIRIFDMAGGLRLDVAGAIAEKLIYNASRADHKRENRQAEGGKAF